MIEYSFLGLSSWGINSQDVVICRLDRFVQRWQEHVIALDDIIKVWERGYRGQGLDQQGER